MFGSLLLLLVTHSFFSFYNPIDPTEFEDTSYPEIQKFEQWDKGPRGEAIREDFATGKITSAVGTADDAIRSVVIEPNGKIVAAGRSYNGTFDSFLIMRYHPDGQLDTSFATTGKLTTSLDTRANVLHTVVRQTDGKYILSGKVDVGLHNGYSKVALYRATSNGSLDTTFNTAGTVLASVNTNITDLARASFLDTTGRVVVVGYGWDATRWRAELLRFLTDGALDTTFSTKGKFTTEIGGSQDGYLGGALHTDGSILAVGTTLGANFDFVVVKYLSDGVLDTAFHTDGKNSFVGLASDDRLFSIAMGTGDLIYVGGISYNGSNNDFVVARLLSSGSLDTAFKTNGRATFDVGSGTDQLNSIQLETNGKVFALGSSDNGSNNDFALLRLETDGKLDTSFDTDGQSLLAIGSNDDSAQSLSLLGDEYIVAAGRTKVGTNFDVAIVRYQTNGTLAKSGDLVLAFWTNGVRQLSLTVGTDAIHNLTLQTDGKFIAQGVSNDNLVVARFNPTGALDTSFSTTGSVTTVVGGTSTYRFGGVAIQTDGKIVAGQGDANAKLNTIRFLTNGVLDTSFFTSGVSVTTNPDGANDLAFVQNVHLDSDERIFATNLGNLRITTDGVLDTTFATDGLMSPTNYFRYSIPMPDNTILQFGYRDAISANMRRYRSDGNLDTSFSTIGTKWVNPAGVSSFGLQRGVFTSDGKLTLYGASGGTTPFLSTVIVRMSTSGTYDTTFSTSGILVDTFGTTAYSLPRGRILVTENGKILVARQHLANFSVKRWNTNGSVDTTFDTDGIVTTDLSGNDYPADMVLTTTGRICVGGMSNAYADFAIACYWP